MNIDNLQEDVIKLLAAMIIGGIIGAEREYRTKSAGFRTLILVSVGSTLFTIFSIRIGGANPDRIAANIITGIGFLGAGAIFRNENKVNGVTTAAIIWATSALGMGIGSGEYLICGIATVAMMIVLVLFSGFEKVIDERNQVRTYRIVCEFREQTLYEYETIFRKHGMSVRRGKQSREGTEIIGTWELQGSLSNHEKLTDDLLLDANIKSFDF